MYLAVIPRDAILEPFGLKVCWKVSGISYFFDNDLSDMKHFLIKSFLVFKQFFTIYYFTKMAI